MKMPVLTSIILFIIALFYFIKKSSREADNALENFRKRESEADNTRKKPLDDLNYITIPDEIFRMNRDPDDNDCQSAVKVFDSLKDQKIVNLTGISNTDLKLAYGAPNLPILAQYDQNYTVLARSLDRYASFLTKSGNTDDAVKVLEFAVETGSDISSTYKQLVALYQSNGIKDKIPSLKEKASSLNSVMSPSILRYLDSVSDDD
ncbi:hypothetical protein SAMN02910370_02311 [Lachnospiraceae bacterium XPB1003]|nr:hypothetical protein SAMN02910370_02311 [Lachnospiraceae bacterium XPB1003]